MLGLAAQAMQGAASFIDVADRCPTPLAVCQRYADSQGFSITTHQFDFSKHMPPQRYDAVLGDCVPQFVPQDSHIDVLRRVRDVMNPKGALVLAERIRASGYGGSHQADRAAEVIGSLAAKRIELPEDQAAFQVRLNRMLDAQRERLARCRVADDLPADVEKAGFRIWNLRDDERERAVVVPGGERVKMKIIVASPTGD